MKCVILGLLMASSAMAFEFSYADTDSAAFRQWYRTSIPKVELGAGIRGKLNGADATLHIHNGYSPRQASKINQQISLTPTGKSGDKVVGFVKD